MKATFKTILLWCGLVFFAGLCVYLYFDGEANENRLTYDLKAALQKAVDYKTKDGHNASKLKAQDLTIQELRRTNPQMIAILKNLYVTPRLAQSYTQLSQELKADISPTVKDTILPARNTKNRFSELFEKADSAFNHDMKIKVLEYQDKWISVIGKIDPPPAKLKILATDTIFTAIYKGERRRPWLWVLSKRQLTTAATNRSPYIKIKVIQSGTIKK